MIRLSAVLVLLAVCVGAGLGMRTGLPAGAAAGAVSPEAEIAYPLPTADALSERTATAPTRARRTAATRAAAPESLGAAAAAADVVPETMVAADGATAGKPELAVPFRVGEALTYDIGWSTYVTAGTATIAVRQKKPSYGSTAYYIVAEGRPSSVVSALYTLYYKVDTLLDTYSLLPQRGSVFAKEGSRSRMKSTRFDQTGKKAQFEVQTATLVKKDMTVPAHSQDALSALYVLRSIPLKTGDSFMMPVSDNGNVYKVHMSVGAVEAVETGIGRVQGIKVTPVIRDAKGEAEGRGMAVWLSNDARRLPLRIETQLAVGTFTIVLRQATGQ